jgi:LPXTG-motif cell wall-anchored protein
MPPEDAVVVDPGDEVTDLGPVPPSEREEQEAEVDSENQLAGTGSDDTALAITGALVVLIGASLVALTIRRRRVSSQP